MSICESHAMSIRPATGNAAEVFRGTSGEGGTQLAGRVLDRDAALHRARHMTPEASSTRDSTLGCLAVRSDDLMAAWILREARAGGTISSVSVAPWLGLNALDFSICQHAPKLQHLFLCYWMHVLISFLKQISQNDSAIAMCRNAPPRILVSNRNVSVLLVAVC